MGRKSKCEYHLNKSGGRLCADQDKQTRNPHLLRIFEIIQMRGQIHGNDEYLEHSAVKKDEQDAADGRFLVAC